MTHALGFDAGEAALRDKLRDRALSLRAATPDSHRKEQAEFRAAKVETLTADADTAGRRMAVERDHAAYEMLKREYSRLTGEVTKATAALSADEESSVGSASRSG